MINKSILKQYTDLIKECEELKPKISRLEKQLRQIESDGVVTDKVKGGLGGIQNFTIKGFPFKKHSEVRNKLIIAQNLLNERYENAILMIDEVESFISSIDDSYTRRLVSFRVVDGLTWFEVAEKMGGGNTEDGVRKAYERFLEKNM